MASHPFVESYLDAWNRNDAAAVGGHLVRRGVYRDVPANHVQNRTELIESLEAFFEDAAHRYELVGNVVGSDATVAFQYRMVPLEGDSRGGELRAIRGAEFIELHKGRATSISDYYQQDDPSIEPGVASANRTSPGMNQRKYAKSGLGPKQIEHYKRHLERLIREEALYLRPDITLPHLAGRLDCSVNHVSQVINAGLGMSFFDWISQHRIEHAKTLLTQADAQPVLSIAYAVGFNSNSAFYTAFRKWVGTTPTAYRDRHG